MKIESNRVRPVEASLDLLIVPVFEDESSRAELVAQLNQTGGGALVRAFQNGEFKGKTNDWVLLHDLPGLTASRLLLWGAGKPKDLDSNAVQRISGAAVRVASKRAAGRVGFALSGLFSKREHAQAAIEGAMLGTVTPALYRSKDEESGKITSFSVVSEQLDEQELQQAVRSGSVMGEAANLARSLSFEPSNVLTPAELARKAEEMAGSEGLQVEILEEAEIRKRGMGALLGVARGSQEPARLITMMYEPAEAAGSTCLALIGKGITFDSGGISIKPAERMDEMKYDMGGGAAVVGAMQAIARLKPAVRVMGMVPAAENLPSGRALKPGDVLRSLSGKTIEVVNTDAEGRLVLCDAITYAISRGATTIVDAATLTGAVVVSLGDVRAGVMGNDSKLIDELSLAGEQSGERLWSLPMDGDYAELIKSDIADVRNVGNRTAGSITAAWFLRHFVGDVPWAHVDIAGTAWTEEEKPHIARGATGFGARLMAKFVLNRAETGAPEA
jgi:leucyl aminopeptidase